MMHRAILHRVTEISRHSDVVHSSRKVHKAWKMNHSRWSTPQLPTSHVKRVVRADVGLAGCGVIAGGLLVTNASNFELDMNQMSIIDYLVDSVGMAIDRARAEWEDPNRRLLMALIGSNTAVYGLWKICRLHPRLSMMMWNNFACSFHGVASERRVHTLLTSAFSHNSFLHLGVNMYMLWHFGTSILPPKEDSSQRLPHRRRQLIQDASWLKSVVRDYSQVVHVPRNLNASEFAKIYFSSAVASSVLSAVVSGMLGMGHVYSIGASGAVFGILTTYCVMHPDSELVLYGALPLTADEMLKLTFLINGVGSIVQNVEHKLVTSVVPGIDFVGHLGGQAAAYFLVPK